MHIMARILITEDEDSLRSFVARALRLDGHETEEAADGAEGLEKLNDGATTCCCRISACP
jgi:two-component system cell cycle response regulator CpdR